MALRDFEKDHSNCQSTGGAWRSLVARTVRDREVGGSNPLAPTITHLSLTRDGSRWSFRVDILEHHTGPKKPEEDFGPKL
jgi:hypothetical protein